jgi:photosystem II stability/assembly factor-like uncharacterized protein
MIKAVVYMQWIILIFSVWISGGCTSQSGQIAGKQEPVSSSEWKVIGPGGGGGVMKPTISPFNVQLVLTHCDMTGVYITHNGGASWKMKNLWNVPDDFEFDPVDSNTIYIATRGFLHSEDRGSGISLLLRSSDQGEKWRILYPDVSKAKKCDLIQSTGLLPSQVIEGAIDGTIQKVAIDPANNKNIFLGIAPLIDYMGRDKKIKVQENVRLVFSADGGLTWKTLAGLPGKNVLEIFPDSKKGVVALFTEKTCCNVSISTGEIKELSLPVSRINSVEGGLKDGSWLVYIMTEFNLVKGKATGGIFTSRDLGLTWTNSINGLLERTESGKLPETGRGFAVCRSIPDVAYLSLINPEKKNEGATVAVYSVYKTIDAGKHWAPVLLSSTPDGYISNNFKGGWMEESFDPGWGGNPLDLGIAPSNPDVCYAGDNGRGYKTVDGGKTWEQVYTNKRSDGSYTSTGLDVTTCYGVHFDPFNPRHFFICYTDIGLFNTFNGGESWFHSIKGIQGEWQNTCYQVAFDPEVKDKVWSVWANAHDLPRTKMFGGDGFGYYQGGVAVSTDGGITWKKSCTGIPENSVCTNILIDRSGGNGSKTIYVSVFDRGIFKSDDDGTSWKPANKGLGSNLFAWQLRQDAKGRLFSLFARGLSHEKTVDGEIYFSDDKAATWQKLQLPDSVNGPHDLLIDPQHQGILYVCCWPRTVNGRDIAGGMIKTEDDGKTWQRIFDERMRVNSAAMDHSDSKKIYFNTFQNAAYYSEDSGNSWKRIEGYRFKWGQRVIPDLNNPGMIFLTTYGGSVFHGPAEGIKGAADDIENMPEGWW